jgi:hypothetical protein
MTSGADILCAGRAPSPARDELTRRLLALVLAAVLVWYTVVVPSGAMVRNSAARAPDEEGHDGEVRLREGEVRMRIGGAPSDSGVCSIAGAKEGAAFGPAALEAARAAVEDLDWPEYIYPD